MTFETLYRRSLDGIEIWKITVDNDTIIVTWGKLNGKQTSKKSVIKEGKNVGKSNETSSHLQAKNEAASKWKKKVDREGYYSINMLGYTLKQERKHEMDQNYYFPVNEKNSDHDDNVLTLTEVLRRLPEIGSTNEGNTLPMLAKSYYRETKYGDVPRLSYPHLIQPKFNGVRALLKIVNGKVEFWSREGKEYKMKDLSARIEQQLDIIFDWAKTIGLGEQEELILDGELYIHNTILADIVSAVKKPNLNTALVKFHCYDICLSNVQQVTRLRFLKSLEIDGIEIVPTMKVFNEKAVLGMLENYINQGYEGLIGRHVHGLYQFGARSSDLVKLKKVISGEFEIIDVYDTAKQPDLAMFKCKNDINDEYFEVVPEGTHDLRRQYMEDRTSIIGKMLTVEYYERTDAPKSLPFHAKGVAIRDYE
jgi:ATP-dependent DNA ligase